MCMRIVIYSMISEFDSSFDFNLVCLIDEACANAFLKSSIAVLFQQSIS